METNPTKMLPQPVSNNTDRVNSDRALEETACLQSPFIMHLQAFLRSRASEPTVNNASQFAGQSCCRAPLNRTEPVEHSKRMSLTHTVMLVCCPQLEQWP